MVWTSLDFDCVLKVVEEGPGKFHAGIRHRAIQYKYLAGDKGRLGNFNAMAEHATVSYSWFLHRSLAALTSARTECKVVAEEVKRG